MSDLSNYINGFITTGIFSNNLDGMGNVVLSISGSVASQSFMAYGLSNNEYNDTSISKLYSVNIATATSSVSQSTTSSNQLQSSYNQVVAQNQVLTQQLNSLVKVVDSNTNNVQVRADKNLIIRLRIQLGQGNGTTDFNPIFPYTPVTPA